MKRSFLLVTAILAFVACGPADDNNATAAPDGTGGESGRDRSLGDCVTCTGRLECSDWTVGASCDWQSCYCFATETTKPSYSYSSTDGQCMKCTEGGADCESAAQELVNHCGTADGSTVIRPDPTGDTGLGECGVCPSGREQCTDWIESDICNMKACGCQVTVNGVAITKTYYYTDARGGNYCYQCDDGSVDCQNEARGVMLAHCSSADHSGD